MINILRIVHGHHLHNLFLLISVNINLFKLFIQTLSHLFIINFIYRFIFGIYFLFIQCVFLFFIGNFMLLFGDFFHEYLLYYLIIFL
jgi:hypothetical protein